MAGGPWQAGECRPNPCAGAAYKGGSTRHVLFMVSRPPGPHSFYIWDCTHREILLCAMQKHILVLADPVAQENPLHFHDLHVMAEYMAAAGFRVTEGDSRPYHFRDRDDEALWQGLLVSISHVEHMSSTRSEQQSQWSQRHFTAQSRLWSLALSR